MLIIQKTKELAKRKYDELSRPTQLACNKLGDNCIQKEPGMIWAIFAPLSKFIRMLFFLLDTISARHN